MDERYYTPQEIADKLKVSISSVRKWYASGKLESTKAGRMIRISEQQLDRFLKQRNSPQE